MTTHTGGGQMATVWKSWRKQSRIDWGNRLEEGKELSRDLVQLGAILRIADALEDIARQSGAEVTAALNAVRAELKAVRAERITPPAPPVEDKAVASRRRAWAAYLKAGGTMSADDGDGVPPRPDESILTLQLSYRARRALQRDDINTVGELLAKTAGELMALRNFGETSLANVRAALARRGLRLKGDPA